MKISKVIFHIKPIPSHPWWECKKLHQYFSDRMYLRQFGHRYIMNYLQIFPNHFSRLCQLEECITHYDKSFLFSQKNLSNIYWKFHMVLNDVYSKSQVDKVDILVFGYHGEWYTLLIIDIIDWNDSEKFVNNTFSLLCKLYYSTTIFIFLAFPNYDIKESNQNDVKFYTYNHQYYAVNKQST